MWGSYFRLMVKSVVLLGMGMGVEVIRLRDRRRARWRSRRLAASQIINVDYFLATK